MAAVEVNFGRAVVKLRRPWVVGALSLIPFYWVFWYYAVNREMRDFGRARGDAALRESRPARSVLAVTLGAFVVVPWVVSWLRTIKRVAACERIAGHRPERSTLVVALMAGGTFVPWIGAFMSPGIAATVVSYSGVLVAIAATVLIQRRLTRLWRVVLA
jgi:hypothetical protein